MKRLASPRISFFRLPAALICLAAVFGLTSSAPAQTVESQLTAGTVQVGQPVELRITTKGKSQGQLLDEVEVEGLQVAGKQDQFQMQMSMPSFGMEVATVQTRILVPTRTGEFTIPSLRVKLDGKIYKTAESVLRVTPATGGRIPVLPAIPVPQPGTTAPPVTTQPPQPSEPPASRPDTPARTHFGEMVIPKESAFVGEVVPVDLRFSVDANFPSQFSDRPNFSGEGFTVLRTSRPSEVTRDVDGFEFSCLVFRTAITAAKAGTLEIPPASLAARVQVPVQAPRSNDFFGGMLSNLGMTDIREIEIVTEPATLDVKPLPRDGRPEDFAGAVGEFKIEASATPAKAEAGEPITLKVVVSGRGNFEAMGPPVIAETEGWKVYDPSENFQPSPTDPVGFNGTKIYEFTLVAREDQKATPPVQFSYFDPAKEQYVTIEGPPVAVQAAGSIAPQPDATVAQAAQATPTRTPATQGNDLSRDYAAADFQPLGWSPIFVTVGTSLAVIWALGLTALLAKRYAGSSAAARSRTIKSRREALKKLEVSSLPDAEFLEGATALLTEIVPRKSFDEAGLTAAQTEICNRLFAKHEEAKYSTRKILPITSEDKASYLKTLHDILSITS